MDSTTEYVAELVEPAIEAEGYSLVDVELKGKGQGRILRLFIDKADGDITLDDCQQVSELLSPMLDVEGAIDGRYFLEVSSPGINRRIKKKADFEKFAGSKIKISMRSPLDGRRQFTGTLEGVENDDVLVRDNRSGHEGMSRIPLAAIDKANLQII
jgi:ribosome maturation factor RimP